MKIKSWLCVIAMVTWTLTGVACSDATPGPEVETLTQAWSETGPVSLITLCGGAKGDSCPEDTYCRHHDGMCGEAMIGWCAPVTEICTMQVDPVCGCDGQTYSNECQMMGAAVSMSHQGACAESCTSSAECGLGETCDLAGCGEGIEGECVKTPMFCNRMWAPVCGCDGQTYSNDCHRVKAGVGLNHEGECAAQCGGIAGLQCEGAAVCYYPEGTCEWADMMGSCELPPKKCPKEIDAVCGCDGVTYRNECMMKRSGVSMDHQGPCCAPMLCLIGEAIDTDGDGCADTCPPAESCEGDNPAGCKNSGCAEGETCAFGLECTPSVCFCDGLTGEWLCTKDCGGGTCVPDEPVGICEEPSPEACEPGGCDEGYVCDLSVGCSPSVCHCVDIDGEGLWNCTKDCVPGLCVPEEPIDLCADFEAPGCVQSGCDEGFVCDTSEGCVPSACGCDPETGMVMCTADCGGGTCVPEDGGGEDLCEDFVAPGCVQSGCEAGYVCDLTIACVPSLCGCDPETGDVFCTMDCGGGTCVPEEPVDAECEEPNPQACKPGECGEGYICDLTIGCEPSSCHCVELEGEGHWNCTKDCVTGVCVPEEVEDLCEDFEQPGCKQSGCEEGFVCDTTVGCVPTSCGCDPETGDVFCTEDCGGGTCVPVDQDLCKDFEQPGCSQSGCDAGFVCDTSEGCVPSSCSCDPESGAVMCTMDCGGGTCVPAEEDLCEDFEQPGCTQSGCDEGFVCDTTVGCVPSACGCDPETGAIMCTADCGGGTCVPVDDATGCCEADGDCGAGQMCVHGGTELGGVCKELPPPAFPAITCWTDAGCPDGETCDGGTVCPCNAACFAPDAWGVCTGGDDDEGPGDPEVPEQEK